VRQLVDKKNAERESMDFPTIVLDQSVEKTLAIKQLSYDSVLAKDERVVLKSVCSFAQGGETARVDEADIHLEFLESFKACQKVLGMEFIGIDLMCDDIALSPSAQISGINEINSAPMAELHYYADLMQHKPLDSAKKFLSVVFN
jgi:D-alanine-D-alanine ligase-like ATP-grasp enzyme